MNPVVSKTRSIRIFDELTLHLQDAGKNWYYLKLFTKQNAVYEINLKLILYEMQFLQKKAKIPKLD